MLVPNYNRASFLPRCLASIRAQTFDDWRVVVGDNASTDGSAEVVRAFGDPRFRVVKRLVNVGYIRNTNLLIDEVDTELVAILHSDDWWERDFLKELVGLLDATPEAVMAISAVNQVVESGTSQVVSLKINGLPGETIVLPPRQATRGLIRSWPFLTPSDVVARTHTFRRFGGFEESLPCSTDWLMWLRLASTGSVAVCQRPLVNNRRHPSSITGQAEDKVVWADEWIRLAGMLEADWQRTGAPYAGAGRELRAMNTLRFLLKGWELHERERRPAALKLTRLAEQTSPSTRWRVGARLERMAIRSTTATAGRRFRQLAGRVMRRMPGVASPASSPRRASPIAHLLAVVRESE